MMQKKYDVAIALRTYAGTKPSRNRPLFGDNKYKMVDLCLKSFKDSLGSLKIKLWAIFDKCPQEWDDLFRKYFNRKELKIIKLKRSGEIPSLKSAMDILIKQKASEIVFMAEDDYFYLPNQFEKMVKFIQSDLEVDFITPYDHLDHYTRDFHKYPSYIKVFGGRHWRTISTTCNTFLTTKKILIKTRNIFINSYMAKNLFSKSIFTKIGLLNRIFYDFIQPPRDSDVWLSLTKQDIFNLFKIFMFRFRNRGIFDIYFRAWRFNWRQILFGNTWKLWCPIPSIATHMERRVLAPTIDWDEMFKKTLDK